MDEVIDRQSRVNCIFRITDIVCKVAVVLMILVILSLTVAWLVFKRDYPQVCDYVCECEEDSL